MWTIDNGGWLSTSSILVFALIIIFGLGFAMYHKSNKQTQIQNSTYETTIEQRNQN